MVDIVYDTGHTIHGGNVKIMHGLYATLSSKSCLGDMVHQEAMTQTHAVEKKYTSSAQYTNHKQLE